MAQLSGFTKAFNMSMQNVLTFAQMKQGQEHRKQQLKQQEFQNKVQSVGLLAPFFGKDNAPSVRRNALNQAQKIFPNSGIDFSNQLIDTPEFDNIKTELDVIKDQIGNITQYDNDNRVIDMGIKESNKKSIELASKNIPNLKLYLPNLIQFSKNG